MDKNEYLNSRIHKNFNEVKENLSWYGVNIVDSDFDILKKIIETKKQEKHIHLDGSVWFDTLKSFWFTGKKEEIYWIRNKWLDEYLKPFLTVWAFLQTKENLYKATIDFIKMQSDENIVYTELRYDPHLHTYGWLTIEDVMESVYKGVIDWMKILKKTWKVWIVKVILWINRGISVSEWTDISNKMLTYLKSHKKHRELTVWFDLNCSEATNPPSKFETILKEWKKQGYKLQIHAGESIISTEKNKSKYVDEAIMYKSDSISHWLLCEDYPETLKLLKKHKIEIEICVASNLQTWSTKNKNQHPLGKYMDLWLKLSINTDNKVIWNISLSEEVLLIHKKFDIPLDKLLKIVKVNNSQLTLQLTWTWSTLYNG